MLWCYDVASCRDDRDRSIWVGRGRPSERSLPTAMRAKPLAASRAARVANKNAVSDTGSVLRFVPPQTQDQTNAAMQQKPVTIVFCVCLARDAAGRPGRDWRRDGRRERCFAHSPLSRRGDEPRRQWAPARHVAQAEVRQGSTPAPRPVRYPATKAAYGLRRRGDGWRRAADTAARGPPPARQAMMGLRRRSSRSPSPASSAVARPTAIMSATAASIFRSGRCLAG